ncbi:MAG TPA: filamentous hemagglutinin N-terminal domain-containing protein, partial [Gammaproteobacteria bacterium]|nr:filamentous hemagglutinin N-terminal domain-containing protein [Gammaproteobacteria bacterium]
MDITTLLKRGFKLTAIASFFFWHFAVALPEGAQVSAGSATVTQSGTTTTINQSSQNTVINWTGFNTAVNETVRFNQPSVSSIALNKINSGLPTNFNGSLFANGQVWIVNPNGVVFGANSQVNVAGLLVTTHNITDSNFMSGQYKFDMVPGFENSKIINNGSITVADTGMVALVAPGVENNGIITANLGKVYLSSGSSFVLDLYGDQLINFGTSPAVQNGYVSNSGTITANGGKVYMTANSAAQVVQDVVSMSGTIEATSVSVNKKGEIILNGGNAGTTRVSGKLKASGGGHIETSGHKLIIEPTAVIDAGQGGSWLVDPYNIIVAGAGSTSNNSGQPNFTPTGNDSTIDVALIDTQLSGGTNVTLATGGVGSPGAQAGDITFNSVMTSSGATATLFLNALHDVTINAAMTTTGQNIDITAGHQINLKAPA